MTATGLQKGIKLRKVHVGRCRRLGMCCFLTVFYLSFSIFTPSWCSQMSLFQFFLFFSEHRDLAITPACFPLMLNGLSVQPWPHEMHFLFTLLLFKPGCICWEPHLILHYFCLLLYRRMNNLRILVSFHTFWSSEPCLYRRAPIRKIASDL